MPDIAFVDTLLPQNSATSTTLKGGSQGISIDIHMVVDITGYLIPMPYYILI